MEEVVIPIARCETVLERDREEIQYKEYKCNPILKLFSIIFKISHNTFMIILVN